MADVRRIFVEKKPGFDVEAKDILSDLRENLNLKSLSDVRIINVTTLRVSQTRSIRRHAALSFQNRPLITCTTKR